MASKSRLNECTQAEFISFMQVIFTANGNGTSDEVLDDLLDEFRRLTEHPDGSDLIFWPEEETQCTPEGITNTVKEWRKANGLPGFKEP